MRAVICVPWRGGVASREHLWDTVRPAMEATGLEVFTGDSDPARPFNRAEARNNAAERAGDASVYCFIDADTWVPKDPLFSAIETVHQTGGAALPYRTFMQMHPVTGVAVPRGHLGDNPLVVSGNIVVARPLWRKVHGWDERFAAYGSEDAAFIRAARVLGPFGLIQGTVVTFEHERLPGEVVEDLLAAGPPWPWPEYVEADTPEKMQAVMDRALAARGTIEA